MISRLVSYEGSRDGIRFGLISFGGLLRRFQYDRLNKALRLYEGHTGDSPPADDLSVSRRSVALELIRRREPDVEVLT